jgi:ribonuclease-3
MSSPASLEPGRTALLADLSLRLGDVVTDLAALDAALRHRSWCGENGGVTSNARLEFLGDAVLQLVITERLYRGEPALPEGVLAQRRSALVNTRALADAARRVDLGPAIRLGRGEAATGGNDKDSILADATEAVIGAVYLGLGMRTARALVLRLLGPELRELQQSGTRMDPKSSLQHLVQARWHEPPDYVTVDEGPGGPGHHFIVEVRAGGATLGRGEGASKREAQQRAAGEAVARLTAEAGG